MDKFHHLFKIQIFQPGRQNLISMQTGVDPDEPSRLYTGCRYVFCFCVCVCFFVVVVVFLFFFLFFFIYIYIFFFLCFFFFFIYIFVFFRLKPLFASVDKSKLKNRRVHFRTSGMKGLSNSSECQGVEYHWSNLTQRKTVWMFPCYITGINQQQDHPLGKDTICLYNLVLNLIYIVVRNSLSIIHVLTIP